jgi:hypothetical protein
VVPIHGVDGLQASAIIHMETGAAAIRRRVLPDSTGASVTCFQSERSASTVPDIVVV